jgi:hypothetical protein
MQEVGGSIPPGSTKTSHPIRAARLGGFLLAGRLRKTPFMLTDAAAALHDGGKTSRGKYHER